MNTPTDLPGAVQEKDPDFNAQTAYPVPVDRISELYRGEIFGDDDIRMARDRIHWMCVQCDGESVLDIGCSQGIAAILLAREGFAVTAIDMHPESIAFARAERAREAPSVQSRLSIIETDLASLADGSKFDSVLLGEVIEHQAQPERLLKAALTRLNPGGRLIVTTPFGLHPHPDHKVSLFPGDLLRFARTLGLGMSSLHVDGSYMRCVYHSQSEQVAPLPDLQEILERTQVATIAAEQRLFKLLHDRDVQLKKRVADQKITQRNLAEAKTALEERSRALKIAQRKLSEATAACAAVEQRLTVATAAVEERSQALKITQRKLGESSAACSATEQRLAAATTALDEKSLALTSTQRKLSESTTALGAAEQQLSGARTALEEQSEALTIAQRTLSDLTSERSVAEQGLVEATNAFNDRIEEQRRHLDTANASLDGSTRLLEEQAKAALANQVKLDAMGRQLRRAHDQLAAARKTQDQLARKVEVRDARLAAAQRRAAALSDRNERIVASTSHRIGAALVAATRSPARLLRLPVDVWTIFRDATRRRSARHTPPKATAAKAGPQPASTPVEPTPRAAAPQPSVPLAAFVRNPSAPPPSLVPPAELKRLKVAAVMDEFTVHSFAPECELLSLSPQAWETELATFKPDMVFIESAWRGANDLWTQKVSNPSPEIMGVIAWCARQGVPTVFWNKEDPVHFGSFQHIAKAVDHVFTTDIDCIARYKRDVGHDRVYLLPFAAQPSVHNPIERLERRDAFCFAGSYYLKYPERQRDFKSLIDVVSQLRPVEIYDRNFHKAHPHYEFPPEYEKYIVGSLPFDQIDKAYKGYRFGINMNTIKQSQTMFARRVFELLASNTIVVSNFSRGVRLLFGDLVICSDAPAELERRLGVLCRDERELRRFRLAGMRKALLEHTYAHRLAYVASKVSGTSVFVADPAVAVLAWAATDADAARIVHMFQSQRHAAKSLVLISERTFHQPGDPTVTVLAPGQADALGLALAQTAWVAPWCADDHYGPNYLTDLALATRYSAADVIGKACFYETVDGAVALRADGTQYQPANRLAARASLVRKQTPTLYSWTCAADLLNHEFEGDNMLALDEFNYCRNARGSTTEVAGEVDDAKGLAQGLSLTGQIFPMAEATAASTAAAGQSGNEASLPGFDAAALAAALPTNKPAGVSTKLDGKMLVVQSRLAADKHAYLYLKSTFSRADLNLETNSRFQLMLEPAAADYDLRTVFEFLDADGRKISHSMIRGGTAHSLAIPAHGTRVRLGFRVQGSGAQRITRLVLGDLRERPSAFVPSSRALLLTKQYPAYDDLYRYGFVHSRVLGYLQNGLKVDVFRLIADEPCQYREFAGVDIVQGDRDLLALALRSGKYRHVLVHLIDPQMWDMLKPHLDQLHVTVWVHGAEIQPWHRREFEFERLSELEVTRQKKLSDVRITFWRSVIENPHPNLRLVFVSQHFADEVAEDVGVKMPDAQTSIIHNFVDGQIFDYQPKPPEMRKKLLSIRPYASRKYANDLTVDAILELSKRPFFDQLTILLVGDGELFEELTEPLRGFPNVQLERRFLSQTQIAALHKDYGVFLTPTRMDSQGVSRDEAMASGLVPITTRVAAIPEFVDDACGIVVPAEDALAMADAVDHLFHQPEHFQALSRAAAERVRRQSGYQQTIAAEIALIRGETFAEHAAV